MYKVSNTRAITRKQRFQRALLYAVPASIVIGILAGYINRLLPLEFEIVYIGVGYLIGEIIKEFGRGVQIHFAILGVVLTAVAFLIADIVMIFTIRGLLPSALIYSVPTALSYVFSSILSLLFRAAGLYMAYNRSRVV